MNPSLDPPSGSVPNDLLDPSKQNEFAFFRWLCERGYDSSENLLGVTTFEVTGRGTSALKTIKTGDLLLNIPEEAILSRPNGLKFSPLLPVLENTALGKDGFTGLVLLLMFEQANPASHWTEFLKVLPTQFETPVFWRRSALEILKPTLLYQDIIKLKTMLSTIYPAEIEPLMAKYPSVLEGKFNFQRFLWAISTVWNRAYWLDDHDTTPGIVPLADMMNHTHKRGVGLYSSCGVADYRFYPEKQSFQVVSYANYRAGEEVFTSYGTKDNTALLSDYGFLLEDLTGAAKTVHLSLEMLPDFYPHIFYDEYPESQEHQPGTESSSSSGENISTSPKDQPTVQLPPRLIIEYVNEILGWLKIGPLDQRQPRNSKLVVCCQDFPWQLVALLRICNLPKDVLAIVTKENAPELKEEEGFDLLIEKSALVSAVAICQAQPLFSPGEDTIIDETEEFVADMDETRHGLHLKFAKTYVDLQRSGLLSILQSLQGIVNTLAQNSTITSAPQLDPSVAQKS